MERLRAAWRNSSVGFRDIWRDEEAFRLECILFLVSIPIAVWLGQTAAATALLIVSGLFVLIVEVINSSIEAAIDRIGPERHELSRKAKDLGSLAVLMSTFVPGITWTAVIIDRLIGT
nr:diacylglycerol kinase [Sulfitobacter aestuariivivens]